MKKYLIMLSIAASLSSCAATPKETNERSVNLPDKELASRFSIKAIKEKREAEYATKLRLLKSKSPSTEVQSALRANNLYLYSYFSGRGGSSVIPGLVEHQPTLTKCRLVQMDGMGDAIYGPNHLQYRQENLRYSAEFNRGMISFCK